MSSLDRAYQIVKKPVVSEKATYDLENNTYHVPVGLGIGQVIPTPNVVYNVFIEPQFTILDRGAGQPQLQLFVGFNMQFQGR